MRCKDWRAWMEAHLDGELGAHEVGGFVAHLEACSTCRAAFTAREAFRKEVRAELATAAPPDLRATIMERAKPGDDAASLLESLLEWLRARPLVHHGLAGAAVAVTILFAFWVGGRPDLRGAHVASSESWAVAVLRYGGADDSSAEPASGTLELGGCF